MGATHASCGTFICSSSCRASAPLTRPSRSPPTCAKSLEKRTISSVRSAGHGALAGGVMLAVEDCGPVGWTPAGITEKARGSSQT